MQDDDPDATIKAPHRIGGPAAGYSRGWTVAVAVGLSAAVLVGFVGFLLSGQSPESKSLPAAPAVVIPATPARTEAEILAQRAEGVLVVRFKPNPAILVLDYPSLMAQGQAFNRMAAFLEKRGLARDHVPDDHELADAITADNATTDTYYYGNDYRAADVQRFFQTADQQKLALSRPEQELRTALTREGMLQPGASGAVISIPREGSDPFVDASGRASLLRHELSHGEYFTNPAYAAFTDRFWRGQMTEADRSSFRGFLSRQGYDEANDDLIVNEAQAHLMHTTDTRYFNAPACSLPVARVEALRTAFLAQMPAGWLRAAANEVRARLP